MIVNISALSTHPNDGIFKFHLECPQGSQQRALLHVVKESPQLLFTQQEKKIKDHFYKNVVVSETQRVDSHLLLNSCLVSLCVTAIAEASTRFYKKTNSILLHHFAVLDLVLCDSNRYWIYFPLAGCDLRLREIIEN